MFKVLSPILAFIITIGLVLTYVRPTLLSVKNTQIETKEYVVAIEKAGAVKKMLEEKLAQKRSFTTVDIERLEAIVPDNVDEVSTVLDIDALARTYRLSLSSISVEVEDGKSSSAVPQVAQEPAGDPLSGASSEEALGSSDVLYTPIDISFTVAGAYEDFRLFIEKLEQSLTLYDVTELSFSAPEGDLVSYTLTVRAYAFNPGK